MAEDSLTEVLNQMMQIANRMDVAASDREIDQIHFGDWVLIWLDTWRRGIVGNVAYGETYARPVKKHLIPYFGGSFLR